MGLFWKTRKPDPTLVFEGVAIQFHRDYDYWELNYQGTQFLSFEPTLTLPSRPELDTILATIGLLTPEMNARLEKTLSGYNEPGIEVKTNDGENFSVNLDEFVKEGTFTVSWSGGASWGDLVADFTIKEGQIVDEAWGD